MQAAIAALHDEAPNAEATDWPQIVALYEVMLGGTDNPVVRLNHAVAVGMATGPRAGLDLLEKLATDDRIAADHRLQAVRAHLLEMAGDRTGAHDAYLAAAAGAMSLPLQRYLHGRAARLTEGSRFASTEGKPGSPVIPVGDTAPMSVGRAHPNPNRPTRALPPTPGPSAS